jgi:signal-transduction protein with cAMP-binding, CBS, and nucleotidyltransferase domain
MTGRRDVSKDVREMMFQLAEEGHVFRLFGDEEVDLLSSHFKIYNYPAGEIVLKPGEDLKMLGILVSGDVFLEEKTELKGN